jgi:protocatechuate 3,4-dioxygenase beta subunit
MALIKWFVMVESANKWLYFILLCGLLLLPGCNLLGNGSATDGGSEVATPGATAAANDSQPINVAYITPAQQEGPYYPLQKPADRDNDLVDLAGAQGVPDGEVLSLSGVVYDASGRPVEGAVVEIWQTDSNGVYMHPDDPGTAGRDPDFQFYGESLTGADGVYAFRTILPGRYEPRPRHIHVKVKVDGQELLTTQFYFAGEVNFNGDEANLVVDLAQAEDDAGNPIWVGARDIVLRLER